MKKIRYSNFEMIEDVIKDIGFNYNPIMENLESCWAETVGEKIKTMAKVLDFSADNVLTIVCSDSYIFISSKFIPTISLNLKLQFINKHAIA